MAKGDDALAAGMPILDGSEQANTLDDAINETRDFIAQRTAAVTPITKGGTGAKTAAAARAALGVLSASEVVQNDGTSNRIGLRWYSGRVHMRVDSTEVGQIANTGDLAGINNRVAGIEGPAAAAYDGRLTANLYSRGTSGQWRSLAVQADGVLAHTASAARFKENIAPLEVTDAQLRAIRLVSFDWRSSGFHDVGLVADEVAAAGLEPFVFADDDGELLGIHYERVALTMLPVVQRLVERVAQLEAARDA